MNLIRLRKQIDQIDQKLLKLLNQRARCAIHIGEIKRREGRPIVDGARETEIMRRLTRMNKGPVPSGAVRQLFHGIFRLSRKMERTVEK